MGLFLLLLNLKILVLFGAEGQREGAGEVDEDKNRRGEADAEDKGVVE